MEQCDRSLDLHAVWFDAVKSGDVNIVTLLLSSGMSIDATNDRGQTALILAIENDHVSLLDVLLQRGASVNVKCLDGASPIYAAAKRGLWKIASKLIERGCDVNACKHKGENLLIAATRRSHLGLVQMLHSAGANINVPREDNSTPLTLACELGNASLVKFLVENGAVVNARRVDGWTPVMVATERRHHEIVELVCQHNADLDISCSYGFTPIFVAVMNNDALMAELLLRRTCRTDVTDNQGRTALMHAAWQCRVEVVNVLCKYSYDVNAQNPKNGRTALHYAAIKNNATVVGLLIDAGACLNVIDRENKTPLNYVESKEVIELLVKYGAYLSKDSWYASRRQSCVSASSRWSRVSAGASSVTDFQAIFQDPMNRSSKVYGSVTTLISEESSSVVVLPDTPLHINDQPKQCRTVDDMVVDRQGLGDYLQKCAQHYLDNHVTGVSQSRVDAYTEKEKMDIITDGETGDSTVRTTNYITQNIAIHIENATYVQTAEGSRIIVRDRGGESILTGCEADTPLCCHGDLCACDDDGDSFISGSIRSSDSQLDRG
ncbi:hypothetical protein Btru_015352 [Bulinus truncatus]|nr:hypothetical protein Btru_015352 [Bulinus truncatus]